ncbi:MAG: tRNA (guanosine(37)-N1)-methyltransferase TrmD [Thiotrichales bacterium]|jgi:tRNA (guanine37-N1)-methyltransferase|nr:tRNA (guanosine(37)-N1)-methyltransferase TrmD [Thiotrichales bacterium]MBT3613343.1 tRNA (guanosine(37)-N1)-methyltransferase TrmD [Thiotrichales bacterium]MBT3753372.1 tRNA (guanosine(37)-N1)-methyltransferase TrmD [Thiotrichales bacterium]MBT3837517.1 tRNA (guanosine(37)-N1)-methyltransferase TrmD [Thiotrichales bacterium]MBT4152355.1 tRNA (guanosine(37)-N1)-methyltransferase TrmD [Thiotrichales bacterium]
MRFDLITIFPEILKALTSYGVTGRAVERGQVEVKGWNPRDYTTDGYRRVDDRPYGGGPGMVMLYEPLKRTIDAVRREQSGAGVTSHLIYLSPQGKPLTQQRASEISKMDGVIMLAGRYEGVDERLIEAEVDEEISIGDYVLSGGELPAMVLMDSIIRLLPGVLGHADSVIEESFSTLGSEILLDYPHYSRPEKVNGEDGVEKVPEVLLSGDHKKIAKWRRIQAENRTTNRRPDLLLHK